MSNRETDDTDLETAVEAFLHDAASVYEEYEEGYVDPDAALWTLDGHLEDLKTAYEGIE